MLTVWRGLSADIQGYAPRGAGGHSGGVSVKGSLCFGHMVYTANPNAYLPMEMMVSEEASKI